MGGHSPVVSELESLTARYPLRERMWANLMLALYRSGRQAKRYRRTSVLGRCSPRSSGPIPRPSSRACTSRSCTRAPGLGAPNQGPPALRSSEPRGPAAGHRVRRLPDREHPRARWHERRLPRRARLAPAEGRAQGPRAELAEDERFRERFVRESRLAASLDHPNVIPIYEAGASGGELFIAMRYVEGMDLEPCSCRRGARTSEGRSRSSARWRRPGRRARAGLVHRDVKPGNVLLARQRGRKRASTSTSRTSGSRSARPAIRASRAPGSSSGRSTTRPRAVKGESRTPGPTCTPWAACLFECLTGAPPFPSENEAGLMYAHLQEPPPSVTAGNPGCRARSTRSWPRRWPRRRRTGSGPAGALAVARLGRWVSVSRPRDRPATAERVPPARPRAGGGSRARARGRRRRRCSEVRRRRRTAGGADLGAGGIAESDRPALVPDGRSRLVRRREQLLTYVPEDVSSECLPLDRDGTDPR